jgi:hypothetical protein
MLHRRIGPTLIVSLLMISSSPSVHAASKIQEVLDQLDRSICRNLALTKCKRQKAAGKNSTTGAKPGAAGKPKTSAPAPVEARPTPPPPVQAKPAPPPVEPAVVPLPRPKPAVPVEVQATPAPVQPEAKPPVPKKADGAVSPPLPRPRPKVADPALPPVVAPEPAPQQPSQPKARIVVEPPPVEAPADASCHAQLEASGAVFAAVGQPGSGQCVVADPVQLASVRAGAVKTDFPEKPTLACGFALRLAQWVKEQANPIVATQTGATITALYTGPGFQCRGRNGDTTAKMSEHAHGNAVDVERFKLSDGRVFEVKDAMTNGAEAQPSLAALRASACAWFTTVLGPGTNSAHTSHFHLDLEKRGKSGQHRLCE